MIPNRKGLSLIELLIAVGCMGMFMSAMVTMTAQLNEMEARAAALMEFNAALELVMSSVRKQPACTNMFKGIRASPGDIRIMNPSGELVGGRPLPFLFAGYGGLKGQTITSVRVLVAEKVSDSPSTYLMTAEVRSSLQIRGIVAQDLSFLAYENGGVVESCQGEGAYVWGKSYGSCSLLTDRIGVVLRANPDPPLWPVVACRGLLGRRLPVSGGQVRMVPNPVWNACANGFKPVTLSGTVVNGTPPGTPLDTAFDRFHLTFGCTLSP